MKHTQKDYAGAIVDYQTSVKLLPTFEGARSNLAFLYATADASSIRDAEAALREAEIALAANPDGAYAQNAKACAFALLGKFIEAIALERDALKNDEYASDKAIDGGIHGPDRIAAWEKEQLWLQP